MRLLTAGESHGPRLVAIIDGVPAAMALTPADIDPDLRRRQLGYGRGARQRIERDAVRITGGVRHGRDIVSQHTDPKQTHKPTFNIVSQMKSSRKITKDLIY